MIDAPRKAVDGCAIEILAPQLHYGVSLAPFVVASARCHSVKLPFAPVALR
eukprot:COSAG02_NODE_127_length_34879_cov_12.705060_7_plen_51_part_00